MANKQGFHFPSEFNPANGGILYEDKFAKGYIQFWKNVITFSPIKTSNVEVKSLKDSYTMQDL